MRWEQENVEAMTPQLGAIVKSCRATGLFGKDEAFVALVRLGGDGHVKEALVLPVNPYSTCAQAGMVGLTFPSAPWEGYWLEIEMQK
jgi:hypothetical protein